MPQFETERTRRFRESGLSERDERTISNVETFGCEVVQVKRTSAGPGWSYTLGVHDTCGQPEVITVGLREETAHFSLNEAADRLRNGVNLAEGRHRDIVGEVECEFRPVDPKWVRHLVGGVVAGSCYQSPDAQGNDCRDPGIQLVGPGTRSRRNTKSPNRSLQLFPLFVSS